MPHWVLPDIRAVPRNLGQIRAATLPVHEHEKRDA